MERIIELSFTDIKIITTRLGDDWNILVYGGDRPHIGCTVISSPRPSLSNDGSVSCTSSVINLVGHKDEFICRKLAESACCITQNVVVCSGGIHMDNITNLQINEVLNAIDTFTKCWNFD